MKKKYIDKDGVFYLIFLMGLTIENQNKIINDLSSRIEHLEAHAIQDSD